MKKILLLLCALLGTVGLWAQVSSLADGGLYSIAFNKNGWYFSSSMKTTSTNPGRFRFDEVGPKTYTIYSVDEAKYLKWVSPANNGTPTLEAALEDTDNFKWTASYNGSTWTIGTTSETVFYLNGWTNTLSESNYVKFFNNATHDLTTLKIYNAPTDAQKAAHAKAAAWEELITSTSTGLMSNSNQWVSEAADASEGWLDRLSDGNLTNYFHSDWHGSYSGTHYIEATLPEATNSLLLYYYTRSTGTGCPKNITVSGSTDGSTWVDNIATINESDMPQKASTAYLSKGLTFPSAYNHFRFYVHSTNSGSNSWFCLAEANLYLPTAEQAEAMTLAHVAAENLTAEQMARIDALDTELRSTTVNVTYALYESDGTTFVTSEVVIQEKNSALEVPSSLTSNIYFDYAPEGTIGSEDCTIKVTRTLKDPAIVYPIVGLSNSKAYTLTTERGVLGTNGTQMVSTFGTEYSAGNFAIISYEGNFYLYSVADSKFVGNPITIAEVKNQPVLTEDLSNVTPVSFTLTNAPYYYMGMGSNGVNVSNYATGIVVNNWTTRDPGNQYVIAEAADFDPTAALAALENYFHPSYFVTYVVKDEGGKTLYTSDPEGTTLGANITTLPSEFQLSDFYDYNTVNITIAQPNTVAEFTATQKESPLVKFTADDASPVWYKMKLNDAYYPTYVADGTPNVTLPPTNADDETVQWAFIGDPYDGFQIICRAANDPTLVLGSASAANDGNTGGNTYVSFAKAGTQTYEKWFPVSSTAIAGGFYLYNGEGIALNQRSTDNLAYWTGGQDKGSTFTVTEVLEGEALYNNLIEQLEAINWGTGLNHYSLTGSLLDFAGNEVTLIAQLKGGYNETNLERAQQMLANYALNMPAEGFYRIQGATSGRYLAAGKASNGKFNMSDATDASTLFYFDGSHLVNYGSGLSNGVTTSVWEWVTENAASTVTFHDGLTNGGYAIETNSAYFYDNGDNSNSADRGGNLTINSSTNARYTSWQLTPVNTLPVTISDAGYATLYAPVALTIPEGVSAYTGVVNKSGDNILLTAISNGKIPAETAVILEGKAGSYNFEVTTANALNIANDLRGTVGGMEVTVTNNSSDVLTLQMIDDEVGLYTYATAAEDVKTLPLAGFKAYLPLNGGLSVKGLTFIFDEDAIKGVEANIQQASTIFNLAGQRVSKAQKGIYIVNGKKVIVK